MSDATPYGDGYGDVTGDGAPELAGPGPAGLPIAAVWRRLAARLADFLIVSVVIGSLVIQAVTGEDAGSIADGGDVDAGLLALAVGINLVIQFVWEAVPTVRWGGTPMKLALRTRVVDARSGDPVSARQSIIRFGTWAIWLILPFLSLLVPLVLVIVGVVMLFTRPARQVVWDLAAKTVVVDAATGRR